MKHSFIKSIFYTQLGIMFFFCFASTARPQAQRPQTYVKTTDGIEYYGTIVHDSSDFVLIRGRDSSEVKIPRNQIEVMESTSGNEWSVKSKYPIIGFSIGTPAVFQGIIGYYFDGYGVRGSGGYYGQFYNGIQINFLKALKNSKDFTSNLSLATGYSQIGGREWTYGAAMWDANWSGLFLELGVSLGTGNYTNPQLSLQFGYLYEFK
jgi:hypothetical protein